MSIRERLKIAYENVAYNADKTWRTEYFNLQKSYMDLFLRESQICLPTNLELRPRTVRDCIPNSKLAKYSNYEYSCSRELSYNMDNISKPSRNSAMFDKKYDNEPWMSEEVNQLFKFYSNEQSNQCDISNNNKIYCFKSYESPFLKTTSLLEYFLKLKISNSQVKKIWEIRSKDSKFLRNTAREDPYFLQKSTSKALLTDFGRKKLGFENELLEWQELDDVNRLNIFMKKNDKEKLELQGESNSVQHKRLYSAVLQGFSTSKLPSLPVENRMTILKRNFTKNDIEKLASINELNRTKIDKGNETQTDETSSIRKSVKSEHLPKSPPNTYSNRSYIAKNNNNTVYNPLYAVNQFQSSIQLEGLSTQSRIIQNSFLPLATKVAPNLSLSPRFRQAVTPNHIRFPSFYMLLQNTLQQQSFLQPLYNPIVLHRSTPVNFENVSKRSSHISVSNQYVSSQAVNASTSPNKTNCYAKTNTLLSKSLTRTALEEISQGKKEAKSSGLISLVNVRKISDISSCSSCNNTSKQDKTNEDTFEDLEILVLKTIDMVLEDSLSERVVSVNESSSERLERQALEQYQNSYDNVFLELERQAAEEYEDNSESNKECSENCKYPPNPEILFGGFFIQCHYFYFSMDKYCKYIVS